MHYVSTTKCSLRSSLMTCPRRKSLRLTISWTVPTQSTSLMRKFTQQQSQRYSMNDRTVLQSFAVGRVQMHRFVSTQFEFTSCVLALQRRSRFTLRSAEAEIVTERIHCIECERTNVKCHFDKRQTKKGKIKKIQKLNYIQIKSSQFTEFWWQKFDFRHISQSKR